MSLLYNAGLIMGKDFFLSAPVFSTYLLLISILAWFAYGLFSERFGFGMKRKTAIILLVIILFSAALRTVAPNRFGEGGGDELGYVTVADSIAQHGTYSTGGDIYFKPYYIFIHLTAPLTYVFSPVTAGRLVNLVLSLLTVLAVYSFGKHFFGQKTGLLAAFFFSFLPSSLHLSNTTESQVASTLVFLVSLTVFSRFLEEEDLFWGLGSTLFIACLVMARSFNWIFVPFFATVLVFRKGFRKDYLIYGGIFALFTWVSFLQNLPMGFRHGGGEISNFAMINIVQNASGILQGLLTNVYYIPLFVLGFFGSLKASKLEKRDITVFSFLMFFVGMLSYGYVQGYFLSKEYYLVSVMLTVFAAYAIVDYVGFKGVRMITVGLIVVTAIFNVHAALSYDSETLVPTTERILEFRERECPNCTIITQDPRPIRAVSDEENLLVLDEGRDLGWYGEKFEKRCYFYYNHRKNLPDYVREFEDEYIREKSPVFRTNNTLWNSEAYLLGTVKSNQE